MSARRQIPPAVTERQIEASDPTRSAWVSANAGSGKTHVLAQRVIRLLLSGVEPGRILCITFTKAAAANMANRVFGILREWTVLPDDALDEKLTAVGLARPGVRERERARRLFALALETPGGLKVQTIHAFCTSLLHLFPFEANVAARFEVLDEAGEEEMLERLTLDVMLAATAEPESPLGRALGAAMLARADVTLREAIREAIRERDKITDWIESSGGLDGAFAGLSRTLGVGPEDTAESIDAAFFEEVHITASEWNAIGEALAQGSKTDQDQASRFRALSALAGTERIKTYLDIFCTEKRDKIRSRIVTGAISKAEPALAERLQNECSRVWALLLRRRALVARDRSVALFTLAYAVIARFRAEKEKRGLLDYEDLIGKTLDLLRDERAAWVHYKLDRGIHHVLIDEAQDTSPRQWDIIRALVAEFFAGEGAHARPRTIFAVGDEKQSIFSFQGAAPAAFAQMRRHFQLAHARAELSFVATEFKHSFRSGPNVLGAVDTVFAHERAYAGLSADPVAPVHESLPEAAPGLVELWEPERADERTEIEPWDAPFDTQTVTSAPVKLARRIAATVAAWRSQGRKAGDVLVLVRSRGALFEAVIRALKNAGVPVAGSDRLVLAEHIAVMDLLALADALLMPHDDLALATVLKSPLFGFDDDELFAIAWNRAPATLRAALRARPEPKYVAAARRLDEWTVRARRQAPFDFYAQLLGADGGRRRFMARLGHEANDALDEFLNRALDHEQRETPSLQAFVASMRAAHTEVKRDLEVVRDEVRVMTVHGAKGLEAPIVVLADTVSRPQGGRPPQLLALPSLDGSGATPMVWAGASADDAGSMADARALRRREAENEHRRLLYVAMTRAIDRLVVCGIEGTKKRPEGCWYDLVWEAIQPEATEETGDDGTNKVWRYRKEPDTGLAVSVAGEGLEPVTAESAPDWLHRPASPDSVQWRPIKPSDASPVPFSAGAGATALRRRAIERGILVHRLLQSLPDLAPAARAAAARAFLARREHLDDAERETIVADVLALLDAPSLKTLFAPGSRAEVPIAGRIDGRPVPGGVVDRLVVTPEAVLIADYKTTQPPPRDLAALEADHPTYVAQLAVYRAILRRLYPDRPVRAVLVWTAVPAAMEVPEAMLDAGLAGVTAA